MSRIPQPADIAVRQAWHTKLPDGSIQRTSPAGIVTLSVQKQADMMQFAQRMVDQSQAQLDAMRLTFALTEAQPIVTQGKTV